MPDYGAPLYWQERYSYDPSQSFDWYMTWDVLAPILESAGVLPDKKSDFEVFVPGCGNSTLSARMYEAGLTNISNVDISTVCISQLRARYAELDAMDFSVLDCTDMRKELPDACFDLAVDKALLDAVLCGDDSFRRATSMVREMYRVLKPGGVYVCVTYGGPTMRLPYLSPPGVDWKPDVVEVGKAKLEGFTEPAASASQHYVYICRKPAAA